VNPGFIDWLMVGDWRIHFLGWHTYRGSAWQSPVGANPLFGYPVGTSVALTDSIPVLAILGKLLDPILPRRFQYIGLWLLSCFVLQGVFGALLMRVATARVSLQVLGAALFATSPVLLHRTGHAALTAHWLLLAALWLHVRAADREAAPSRRSFCAWCGIVALAAATHPYLAIMVMAIAAAHVGGMAMSGRRRRWQAVQWLPAWLALAGLVAWQCGLFAGRVADLDAGDFGHYSMNLLGPLTPTPSFLLGRAVFPTRADAPEEFSYVGLGVLLSMAPAVFVWLRTGHRITWRAAAPHVPLALTLLLLTAIALGPTIRLGEVTLFAYDGERWGPMRIFRANGRMFWPVLYALSFATLATVARGRGRLSIALLGAALAVQAIDVSPAYRDARGAATLGGPGFASEFWRVVPPHYRHLTAFPTNICPPGRAVDFEPLALVAGDFHLSVNSGLAARYDADRLRQYCQDLSREISSGVFDPDTLYVFTRDAAAGIASGGGRLICFPADGYVACAVRDTYVRWQDVFDATVVVLPPAAEFLNAHADLEGEYQRMGRGVVATSGSVAERVDAIRSYLVYRVTGCGHADAMRKVFRTAQGEAELRVCGNPLAPPSGLPSRSEMFAFRRELDARFRELGRTGAQARIDLEGEAVWLLEYARARLGGESDEEAQSTVREMVRRAARPSP
jgi:hypothetical protein